MGVRRHRRHGGRRGRRCGGRRGVHVRHVPRFGSRCPPVMHRACVGHAPRPDSVVERTPIAELDVQPRLVAVEGGMVGGCRPCGSKGRVTLIRMRPWQGRDAERHDGHHPSGEVVHRSNPSDASTANDRRMPVRTHERHQASRGGLTGSDASWRALLAARDECRGRRRGGGKGLSGGLEGRDERHRRCREHVAGAAVCAQGALAGVTGAAVIVMTRVRIELGMVARAVGVMLVNRRVLVFRHRAGMLERRMMVSQPRRGRAWAQHASRHGSAKGNQHGQEHQQPDTNGFHGRERITVGRVYPQSCAFTARRSEHTHHDPSNCGKVKWKLSSPAPQRRSLDYRPCCSHPDFTRRDPALPWSPS